MGPKYLRGVRRRLTGGGLVLVGLLAGCGLDSGSVRGMHSGEAKDIGTWPPPNGSYLYRWKEEQDNRAEASDFTIFLTEWYMGGTDLGPYGLHHLGDIAKRLPTVRFPVVIEPHLDTNLNEKRRELVVQVLTNQGFADAESRVVIAFPQAEFMYGEEGVVTFNQMLFGGNNGRGRGGYNNQNGGMGGYGGGFGGSGYGTHFGSAGYGGSGLVPYGGGGGYGGGYGRGGGSLDY
ncbi:MAG: hypothetical protein ACJ8C4_17190 [Gemmataceae bacterium]